jgi:hypothetical protein
MYREMYILPGKDDLLKIKALQHSKVFGGAFCCHFERTL